MDLVSEMLMDSNHGEQRQEEAARVPMSLFTRNVNIKMLECE